MKRWRRQLRAKEIYEIAEHRLHDAGDVKEIHELISELTSFSRRGYSTMELEARAMLHAAGRVRPKRFRRLMMVIQRRRHEAGEISEFETFEKKLKDSLNVDFLIGHSFNPETFKSQDHNLIWTDVEKIISKLQNVSKGAFLNSGTLLGVTRDRRLIDHDDDIDIGICLNASNEKDAAAEWFSLRMVLDEMGILNESNSSPLLYKTYSKGNYQIDLFPCWIEEGQVNIYPHTKGELKIDDLFPLKQCDVTKLPVPANPARMLEQNYGKNWCIPDPYFCFDWTASKIQFGGFEEEVVRILQQARSGQKPFSTVITYGTFDLFHVGHVRLLGRLSKLGERLIVGCSTDEFNERKGKRAICSYEDRAEILRACEYVTEVIPENNWEQKRHDIEAHNVDLFAMGFSSSTANRLSD